MLRLFNSLRYQPQRFFKISLDSYSKTVVYYSMDKFFDYSNSDQPQWFHIRAKDTDMDRVITFWLWGDSELHIRELLYEKSYKDIEWIRAIGLTLPFV